MTLSADALAGIVFAAVAGLVGYIMNDLKHRLASLEKWRRSHAAHGHVPEGS
ncbi:MAG TPA: hypothetical protein VEC14_13010 [Reyranellaceae bacterium]|nr:hypothetical protein [Reyranellaceae bacterium]